MAGELQSTVLSDSPEVFAMSGVTRLVLSCAFVAFTATACATKVPPPSAGEPRAQLLQLEEVPRHVDDVMRALQVDLLVPVRAILRAAPVSTTGVASDGSYTRWLTEVSESIVSNKPLPKNFKRMSEHAYSDLARIAGRSNKKGAPVTPDLSVLAQRLHAHFETQRADVRKTAAAYLETAFSIPG